MSVFAHMYQRPRCMDDDTPAEDCVPASTRSRRPRQKTTSNDNGPTRSHPTNPPTTSSRLKSGKQMHGAFQNHERDVRTSSRLRPSTDRYPMERQHHNALRTMRDVWESAVAHSPDHGGTESKDEAEQSHIVCVHTEATGRDCGQKGDDDASHAVAESSLGMLDEQYYPRTQPGRVRCSTCRPGEFRGCRREHGFQWGRRDTEPLKVEGQLKGVDQEACLQLICESGQRLENQVTSLGLVSRQKVESGEQVTESLNIPEGFFNCVLLDSQPTKSVPRRVRLAIERNIDDICPNRNPQSRLQHENLDVRSVGTTRPLRGVALFDEMCDLTDEDAQEATVRACRSVNRIIILGIPSTVSRIHSKFCMTLCTWQHERGGPFTS